MKFDEYPRSIPVLLAEPVDASHVRVWCPYCRRYHTHGGGKDWEGHRVAHCTGHDEQLRLLPSPFRVTGYVLAAASTVEPKQGSTPA